MLSQGTLSERISQLLGLSKVIDQELSALVQERYVQLSKLVVSYPVTSQKDRVGLQEVLQELQSLQELR